MPQPVRNIYQFISLLEGDYENLHFKCISCSFGYKIEVRYSGESMYGLPEYRPYFMINNTDKAGIFELSMERNAVEYTNKKPKKVTYQTKRPVQCNVPDAVKNHMKRLFDAWEQEKAA